MPANLIRRRRLIGALALMPWTIWLRPAGAAPGTPRIEVWKDPACGCCKKWMELLRQAGFTVISHDQRNAAARAKARISPQYGSCHTSFIEGYAIEGHVPVREIRRLLTERPDAIGLAVPGMVNGSPGMEQGGRVDPYDVLLLHRDGGSSVFAKYRA